jgi:hypothetical protein
MKGSTEEAALWQAKNKLRKIIGTFIAIQTVVSNLTQDSVVSFIVEETNACQQHVKNKLITEAQM